MGKRKRTIGSRNAGHMLVGERRQHILHVIQTEGRALVDDLSESLGISRITIRKDLDFLQAKGLIERTHGGALPIQHGTLADPTLKEKEKEHHAEKLRIAVAAAKLVQEGQCVMLDSGTTTMALTRVLKRFESLTVITNAVNIAAELAGTNLEVILTGGALRKNSFSLVGPLAEDVLREMHADILFLGVDGFDVESGPSTPNVLESRVNRRMVESANRVVVVCDSTKFMRRSLARIVPAAAIHHVITDKGLPHATAEALRAQNIEVTLV